MQTFNAKTSRKTRQHVRLIRLSVWRFRYRQLFSIPICLLQSRKSILQWKPKLRNAEDSKNTFQIWGHVLVTTKAQWPNRHLRAGLTFFDCRISRNLISSKNGSPRSRTGARGNVSSKKPDLGSIASAVKGVTLCQLCEQKTPQHQLQLQSPV